MMRHHLTLFGENEVSLAANRKAGLQVISVPKSWRAANSNVQKLIELNK